MLRSTFLIYQLYVLINILGGPTSETRGILNLSIQYWTSRGWAFVDVNYGGSTGMCNLRNLKHLWMLIMVEELVCVTSGILYIYIDMFAELFIVLARLIATICPEWLKWPVSETILQFFFTHFLVHNNK